MPVRFTAEGGYEWNGPGPNPFVQERESRIISLRELSRVFNNWGMSCDVSTEAFLDDCINHLSDTSRLANRSFTVVDRGSLLRIATATEKTNEHLANLTYAMQSFTKELRSMMVFWKQLKKDYDKQKRDRE